MSDLSIYFERELVGHVDVRQDGAGFRYDGDWLDGPGTFPVSSRMPLSRERVPAHVFQPWIANLLPEGESLQRMARCLGVATNDPIGILTHIGRDTAGALSFGQPGNSSTYGWRPAAGEIERIIERLSERPFLIGDNGVSMTLAGVQPKLGVSVDAEGAIYIPTGGSPSTHILKPESHRLWGGVQNEAFCLTLARRAGVPAAPVTTGRDGSRSYLLVTRYDRSPRGDKWHRLHQEDFCQALALLPSAKYQSNQTRVRGPTLVDLASVVRRHAGALDVLRLLDAAVFNVIACNTDAHAKNYSLIITARGASLAPLYDVMCGEVWEGITRNLAQKVGGQNRGEHIKAKHWQRLAVESGLNPKRVIARVRRLATSVLLEADAAAAEVAAMPAGDHPLLGHVKEAVTRRARRVLQQLDEPSPKEDVSCTETEEPNSSPSPSAP